MADGNSRPSKIARLVTSATETQNVVDTQDEQGEPLRYEMRLAALESKGGNDSDSEAVLYHTVQAQQDILDIPDDAVLHKDLKTVRLYTTRSRLIWPLISDYDKNYKGRCPDGVSIYDFMMAKVREREKKEALHRTSIHSIETWLTQFWTDYAYFQPDGRVEFFFTVSHMRIDRMRTMPDVDSVLSDTDYISYCCLKDSVFCDDTDEQYCDAIKKLMKEYVAGRDGTVFVAKGINETDFRFGSPDFLEYHWIPETIGKDFKKPKLDQAQ